MPRIDRFKWAVLAWIVGSGPGSGAGLPELERSAEFRFTDRPGPSWRVTQPMADRLVAPARRWLRAQAAEGSREGWISDRVAIRLRPGAALPRGRLDELGLVPSRELGRDGRVWVLQAPDAWSAATAAMALAGTTEVERAAPVMRQTRALHGGFGPRPRDPLFTQQWHLENRDADGLVLGPDLNPRAAWTVTRGEGVTIGFADTGFETDHPDLRDNAEGAPHRDFIGTSPGAAVDGDHGTLVAGLAGARGDNGIGVVGVAPRARLAGWTVFDERSGVALSTDEEGFAAMFGYRNEDVAVQNHSWGGSDEQLFGPSLVEEQALADAFASGRGGRGVVMVRSAGNLRDQRVNANDDGFANDPRVIAVAAVRKDGRVASYSNPGACLLVSAPSSDDRDLFLPTPGITTTDRVGSRGWNPGPATDDAANYASDFDGTSASAPQISGVVALMLSANPALTLRDVQQVLIHASSQPDPADPSVQVNGAGYRVSHNQGFGVPDAGQAVRLAQAWRPRSPLVTVSVRREGTLNVPDDGLRVWVAGAGGAETSLRCGTSLGVHPDEPTAKLPLVFVGRADADLTEDLHGRAALIERGVSLFRDKAERAVRAGAGLVIIYNHLGGTTQFEAAGTDFVPVPVMTMAENDGRALVTRLAAGESVMAQVRVESVSWTFAVTNTLACEQVGVRVRASHRHRGDLRIVLRSPAGTRSVLQQLGIDSAAGPSDWTYWSSQHFYEASAGTWTVSFADEQAGTTGSILEAELLVRGTALEDTDKDGLDDRWERVWFGDLSAGPRDDPDHDGSPNGREQALGTDPLQADEPFRVALDPYDPDGRLRLSWPGRDGLDYRILRSGALGGLEEEVARVPGRFPEVERVVTRPAGEPAFFRIQALGSGGESP